MQCRYRYKLEGLSSDPTATRPSALFGALTISVGEIRFTGRVCEARNPHAQMHKKKANRTDAARDVLDVTVPH